MSCDIYFLLFMKNTNFQYFLLLSLYLVRCKIEDRLVIVFFSSSEGWSIQENGIDGS